ncbi:alpha-tocopherol transfer protein-like [Musca domestica]|uniref:Alpha-tocopherol transfer protein-like n=1 Tax=Musca domestica TaxID=7370 RepID=A0A1I8MW26_MUSDO|nr:alpha-tocopherol transfer protein-like [Musca domestica]
MSQIQPLSEELQIITIDELNENPLEINSKLNAFRAWIVGQPHLRARIDDQFLLQFLRSTEYDLTAAGKKLDNFFAFKTVVTNQLEFGRAKFWELYYLGIIAVLPTPLNDNGPRLIYYRYLYSPDLYRIEELIEMCNMVNESLIKSDPYAGISGVVYIFDMSTVSLKHILQYSLSVVKQLVMFYEKSLPLRIKEICFTNVPLAAEHLFKLLLPCLSKELRQRVTICGKNMENLTRKIPQNYLPRECGGSNGSLAEVIKDYAMVLEAQRQYFEENSQYGTDENLRQGVLDFDGLWQK